VWRKAHALAINVNKTALTIKGGHYASLRSQLIRAALSIPANIVEGRGQRSDKNFARFLNYAINSASELESHLLVAHDLAVVSHADFNSLTDQTVQVRKMLHGLLTRVTQLSAT